MRRPRTSTAKTVCENILRQEKQYNLEHRILASENQVIDRLLGRGHELADAYEELHKRLESPPWGLQSFIRLLLSCVAHWSEPKLRREREARRELSEINKTIASTASDLADLLDRRNHVRNHSAFSDSTLFHPVDLIKVAAAGHHRFERWVSEPLDAIHCQFDLKYWPGLDDLMRALSRDATQATIEATDPLTAAATASTRASPADVFRALLAGIEEHQTGFRPALPKDFRPTDATLASLMNCALDLGPEELVASEYVKRLRQRDRTSGRN